MDNIIECRLDSTCKEIYTGIWQHDYGQILRITGVDLPKAVEVQFSLRDKGGDTLTRIGTTVDGVTEVKVPDSLLKNENCTQNYLIYAWIYITDDASGNTEYQIILHVKSRPKPEKPTEEPLPEPNIFHETVEAVNASADRAEMAEQNAKGSAEKAETALADMKETVGNLTETVEQAEKLDGNLDKKLEQGENIVANIKDKLDAPLNPLVGKYLRVKAVNEDGVPELEWVDEPSGGSSLDIQIDGQSIVKDGVAEIPLCTKTKGPGLIAIDLYSNNGGLYRANYNTGLIRVAKASNNSLDERANSFCPVVPANLDYAVKAAMCDGKGVAWTAEEQAAARERMGAYRRDYRLIADITLEQESYELIVEKDADGKDISLRKAKIFVFSPAPRENSKNNGYVQLNDKGIYYGAIDWKVNGKNSVTVVNIDIFGEIAPTTVEFVPAHNVSIAATRTISMSVGNILDYYNEINKITILANFYFDKGTRFIIIGKE